MSEAEYRVESTVVPGRDGPIRIREYLPAIETSAAPFLWVHGGGFAGGGLDQKESDAPARFLAAGGRRVRTVDYRLVSMLNFFRGSGHRTHPNRYPAALHDVVDVATDLAAVTGGPITLGGASAGANLAAAAAMMFRDRGDLDLISLVLAYGAFHSAMPENAQVEGELTGRMARWMFNPSMTRRVYVNYVGDPELLVPGYAVPGGADLHGLPPTFLMNADNDRLRASGEAFADELRTAGVEVSEQTVVGRHGFLNSPGKPGFDERMRAIDDWMRQIEARSEDHRATT